MVRSLNDGVPLHTSLYSFIPIHDKLPLGKVGQTTKSAVAEHVQKHSKLHEVDLDTLRVIAPDAGMSENHAKPFTSACANRESSVI